MSTSNVSPLSAQGGHSRGPRPRTCRIADGSQLIRIGKRASGACGFWVALVAAACGGPKDGTEPDKPAAGEASPPSTHASENTAASKGDEPNKASPTANKKPKSKYSQGSLIPKGIPLADVPVYNKAQGDPVDGEFDMPRALADAPELADKSLGELTARVTTSMGRFDCVLFEDEAPYTVASFVGLARGVRPFLDRKSNKWIKKPYFDQTVFHRVIRGFMVQGGDRSGSGRGRPGFVVRDEFVKNLRHNRAGMLSMANSNVYQDGSNDPITDPATKQALGNTGTSQFFVTVGPAPHLDDRHTVFGQCVPKVPIEISKVRVKTVPGTAIDHRPTRDVRIESIEILRKPASKSKRKGGKRRRKKATKSKNK